MLGKCDNKIKFNNANPLYRIKILYKSLTILRMLRVKNNNGC